MAGLRRAAARRVQQHQHRADVEPLAGAAPRPASYALRQIGAVFRPAPSPASHALLSLEYCFYQSTWVQVYL
eukprot:scaffold11426_cov37-Phaeocystis_antarctica.AAC.1